ncbi:MAG TPA: hypothetical protein VGN49_00965 [Micrococcaceae bacterium]|nr:hypothetical protein [Micrococcaceae bacterium]
MTAGLLLTCVAALPIEGCGGAASSPLPTFTDKSKVISDSRSSASAPDAFRSRQPLPNCGGIVLDQAQSVPQTALDCMASAAGAAGAELALARPTSEGDYVVTFYRVGASISSVEVFVDATRDQFGKQEWRQGSCPSVRSMLDPRVCDL